MKNSVKAEEIEWIPDIIGEKVDGSTLPFCDYHEDCFANANGKCTALIVADSPCAFYKSAVANREEIQRSVTHLKRIGRYDLIFKYAFTLAMIGALDSEIEEMRRAGRWLDEHQKSSLAGLMRQVMEGNLSALGDSVSSDDADILDEDEEAEEGEDEHEV